MRAFDIASILILTSILLFTGGCREDEAPFGGGQKEDFTGVVVNIPVGRLSSRALGAGSATRGDSEDVASAEGYISSIYFFAFPQGEGEKVAVPIPVAPADNPLYGNNSITAAIDLAPGCYRFVAVGNIPELEKSYSSVSEEKLEAMVVKHAEATILEIPESGLPMECGASDFRILTDDGRETGVPAGGLKIEQNKSYLLHAPMRFTHAKVRFNIFNMSGQKLEMSKLNCRNISLQSPLFPVSDSGDFDYDGNGTAQRTILGAATLGSYHPLTATAEETAAAAGASTGMLAQQVEVKDLDRTGGKALLAAGDDYETWHYQAILYLPERRLESADSQSALDWEVIWKTGGESRALREDMKLGGEPGQDRKPSEDARELLRSHLYQYNVYIGLEVEIRFSIDVEYSRPWELESVGMPVSGTTELWVDHTKMGYDDEAPVDGNSPRRLYYDSDTEVTLEPETDAEGRPTLILTPRVELNRRYIEVAVNPEIISADDASDVDTYFYIVAGNLHKKIDVRANYRGFLYVWPQLQSVRIADYRNKTSHSVEYGYVTNLGDISVSASYTTDINNFLTAAYTPGLPPSGTAGLDTPISYFPEKGADYGSSGNNEVLLDRTSEMSEYLGNVVIRFEYTTSERGVKGYSYLQIIPSGGKYKVHFRGINFNPDDPADEWWMPHAYVYDHMEKYIDGVPCEVMCDYDAAAQAYENAITYSYTGGVTFLGWNNMPDIQYEVIDGHMFYAPFYWDPWDGQTIPTQYYTKAIDYMADHKRRISGQCSNCDNGVKTDKWPGLLMIREEPLPGETYSWYTIELPEICTPGKTLIMFTNGHQGSQNSRNRYPAHLIPGVPLFDYDDREGWFVYDPTSGVHEFVDDRPDVEAMKKR